MDEGRFGLKGELRRRWCPRGTRPPWIVEDRYEWVWVYAAIEPSTGWGYFLFLPFVNHLCFQEFLDALLSERSEETPIALVLDNAPSHRSRQIAWADKLRPLRLPPYSPELNPAEQVFRQLRQGISNRVFETLDSLVDTLTDAMKQFWENPRILVRLTNYPWWKDAVQYITSSPP